jgi:uncharacterized protein (DUF3820 family)
MSGISNVELKDTVTFGKYKGKTFEEVYKLDAAYLVWLRQEKANAGDRTYFAQEVHVVLDHAIKISRDLRTKYKPFGVVLPETPAVAEPEPEPIPEPAVAYAENWGAF